MDDLGRPLLRPGWQAARFDDSHLQVGLDAPARVVLADSPDVRRLLTVLADPDLPWEEPTSLPARRALDRLRSAEVVVAVPGSSLEARLAAEHGASAPARLAARRAARVCVQAPPDLSDQLASMLRAEGIAPVTAAASLTVVASSGPVRRSRLDALLQDGRAHLVVSGGPTGWDVGPLVVPGRTACLRCVDAAQADAEPRRAVVVDQLARSPVPPPVSPTLRTAALALAAREVASFVDGDPPLTWSASLTLGTTRAPALREWPRHPLCGCAWDVVLAEDLS